VFPAFIFPALYCGCEHENAAPAKMKSAANALILLFNILFWYCDI